MMSKGFPVPVHHYGIHHQDDALVVGVIWGVVRVLFKVMFRVLVSY